MSSNEVVFWVTMTDRCLSGWGMAKGKINKLVIECSSLEEAEIVAENGRQRSEMKYVNIVRKKPSYSSLRYYVSYKDLTQYNSWRIRGFFKSLDRVLND